VPVTQGQTGCLLPAATFVHQLVALLHVANRLFTVLAMHDKPVQVLRVPSQVSFHDMFDWQSELCSALAWLQT